MNFKAGKRSSAAVRSLCKDELILNDISFIHSVSVCYFQNAPRDRNQGAIDRTDFGKVEVNRFEMFLFLLRERERARGKMLAKKLPFLY